MTHLHVSHRNHTARRHLNLEATDAMMSSPTAKAFLAAREAEVVTVTARTDTTTRKLSPAMQRVIDRMNDGDQLLHVRGLCSQWYEIGNDEVSTRTFNALAAAGVFSPKTTLVRYGVYAYTLAEAYRPPVSDLAVAADTLVSEDTTYAVTQEQFDLLIVMRDQQLWDKDHDPVSNGFRARLKSEAEMDAVDALVDFGLARYSPSPDFTHHFASRISDEGRKALREGRVIVAEPSPTISDVNHSTTILRDDEPTSALAFSALPGDTFDLEPDSALSLPDDATEDYARSRVAQALELIEIREATWHSDKPACYRAIKALALFDVDEITEAERRLKAAAPVDA